MFLQLRFSHFLHTCNKTLCFPSGKAQFMALLSNCCFQSDLFPQILVFQSYQNTPQRQEFLVRVESCFVHTANTGSSPKSLALINTEVKRRILSFWDGGGRRHSRPQVGFCLQSVMAFHSLHRIPPLQGHTEKHCFKTCKRICFNF